MLLLDTVVDIGADFAVCEWRAGPSAFLDPIDGVPAYTGIEIMAQCIAVLAGARARSLGLEPPMGLLLGTRRFESSIGYFEPGRTYLARCDALFRDMQGMSSFACELLDGDRRIASARLAVLERLPG
jgi:predicted hotdog family 3-hydroxylacyl-ACP dehydratase